MALLLAGCSQGGGTPAGLASVLSTAAPSSSLTIEQVKRVCQMSDDDLVDAAQLLAEPGLEDAERAMQAAIDYSCPKRSDEYAGIVDRYREAMDYPRTR